MSLIFRTVSLALPFFLWTDGRPRRGRFRKGRATAPDKVSGCFRGTGMLWLLGVATAQQVCALTPAREEPALPSFLVILVDDMGFSDAGCYGGEISTPAIDGLADEGVRFTQFYSNGRCWPSRATLMSGYYAQEIRSDPPQGNIPSWARLLPHYLKPLGYRSYHAGKWHVIGAPDPVDDGGFDLSYNLGPPKRTAPPVKGDQTHISAPVADAAIGFLKEHEREHPADPFFLYLCFTAPHHPLHASEEDITPYRGRYDAGWDVLRTERLQALRALGIADNDLPPLEPDTFPAWNMSEEELLDKYGPGEVARAVPWESLTAEQRDFQARKMEIYAGMITRMDHEIDRVLEQVRAMGAEENTVVIFASDNGSSAELRLPVPHDKNRRMGAPGTFLCLGPGWASASNTPFRLHKSFVHEGGVATPLIVRWPAGLKARGGLRNTPGHLVDLLPTILEIAGAEPISEWNGLLAPALPGQSLLPVLENDSGDAQREIYFHHMDNRALRVGDWKLVARGAGSPWELYHLKTDRGEQHDLAGTEPEKLHELAALWQKHEDDYLAQARQSVPALQKP